MGDLIRYPVMKTVKDAAATYGLPPTYIRTLCRYFEAGDPVPAEQDEAVGGIRRVAGR